MIKRQVRIQRLEAVAAEYRAGKTASDLLHTQLRTDPNYGDAHAWTQRAGRDFRANLEATYIIRLFAEFESTLRDYWLNFRRRNTEPPMVQLVNDGIPGPHFPQDFIDNANEVRLYRNYVVHDLGDVPPPDLVVLDIQQVERRLRAYISRLQPDW